MPSKQKTLKRAGLGFLVLGFALAIKFWLPAKTDPNPSVWLTAEYYSQFLPVAISVMLLLCGVFIVFAPSKANFNLAVFGHTASEEALFDWIGFTQSALPTWTLWVFFLLSIPTLWIAYSNALHQKRLSWLEALFGIGFGTLVVLLPRLG